MYRVIEAPPVATPAGAVQVRVSFSSPETAFRLVGSAGIVLGVSESSFDGLLLPFEFSARTLTV